MSSKYLNGLKTVRRKYARKKNFNSAVNELKNDTDKNVIALVNKYNGTAKELLKSVKNIKKGVSSKVAINSILELGKNTELVEEAIDNLSDGSDPVIDIQLPANIECNEPEDPKKKSIVVMNADGLVGCGSIGKQHLRNI